MAPKWSDGNLPDYALRTAQRTFQDSQRRTVILRGVNLCGKSPLDQPSHNATFHLGDPSSKETASRVSFVGVPLKLNNELDTHLERLKGWGFTCIRMAVAWEAIEHSGPGIYDEEYITYLINLLHHLQDHGFRVLMDPHQDCWSRASGGSGAPYWTLNACGLDPINFQVTQAAICHGSWNGNDGETPDEEWPDMIWQTNGFRLACATIFTLFFAGRMFAPKCIIDGVNIQHWLTEKYLGAFGRLADRIAEDGELNDVTVIGWDSINEPSEGFIGLNDLSSIAKKQTFKKGPTPSPLQAFQLGMGSSIRVKTYKFGLSGSRKSGHATIDPKGRTAWLAPEAEPEGVSQWGWRRDPGWTLGTCIWGLHGVWDVADGALLKPAYFERDPYRTEGDDTNVKPIDFLQDCYEPHWKLWNDRIRNAHPLSIAFINPPVFSTPPSLDENDQGGRVALSPHYYDGLTLLNKRLHSFNADAVGLLRKTTNTLKASKFGLGNIRGSMRSQIQTLSLSDTQPDEGFSSYSRNGENIYPSVIGECGVPFDFKKNDILFGLGKGETSSDYHQQEKALDGALNAMDGKNLIGWFIWAYEPRNTKELGDGWNGEDLSIFSSSDYLALHPLNTITSDPNPPTDFLSLLTHGARAPRAFSRPYPLYLAGRCLSLEFSIAHASVTMEIDEEEEAQSQGEVGKEGRWTVVFVPLLHFAQQQSRAEDQNKEIDGGKGGKAEPLDGRTMDDDGSRVIHEFRAGGARTVERLRVVSRPSVDQEARWSTPRFDVSLQVELKGGKGDVEFEAVGKGQWLKWRWTPIPGADKEGGRDRKIYSVTIRRFDGQGGDLTRSFLAKTI